MAEEKKPTVLVHTITEPPWTMGTLAEIDDHGSLVINEIVPFPGYPKPPGLRIIRREDVLKAWVCEVYELPTLVEAPS